MPLSASHIKFALDMKDYFKPKNLQEYFTGAVYPDSRYLSGIDRNKTHSENFWSKDFWGENDFKKGWASHNISDKAYVNGIRKIFPAWIDLNEDWVKIENAAVKVLGDISLLSEEEIVRIINSIDSIPNFNNESAEAIKEHLQTMKDCYKNGDKTTISDYINTMQKTVGKEVITKAEFFSKDEKLSKAIKGFFREGIKVEIEKILSDINSNNS